MFFCPVHDIVVYESLAFKQVLELPLNPNIIWLLLELQRLYIVKVLLKLLWKSLTQVLHRY